MQDATAYAAKCQGSPVPAARGAEWVHHMLGPHSMAPLSADLNPDPATATFAYINHGRWVVDCPECRNAQLACRTDPRFMCNECGNVGCGRLWRQVVWPTNIQKVEGLLTNRPLANQNWTPDEKTVRLAIDNLAHMGKIK